MLIINEHLMLKLTINLIVSYEFRDVCSAFNSYCLLILIVKNLELSSKFTLLSFEVHLNNLRQIVAYLDMCIC